MKKTMLLLSAVLICGVSFAQKKKTPAKSANNKTVLTKNGSITAELVKGKDAYRLYLLNGVGKKADTVSLERYAFDPKAAETKVKNLPENLTITPFTAKGTKLYNITWIEKSLTEIPDKKEDATRTVSQIWNLDSKAQLYANTQTATKITEILYLDKGKNASQTSEKMRNEGFTMTVSPDGDLILKNRTQENRMGYDATTGKYAAIKSAPQPAAPAKKKK